MCFVHCDTEWTRIVRHVSCVLCTVTQNGHVLLEMCLVHCDTQWTRVVRDVSLEFYCCLQAILFPTDLPGDFLVADPAQRVSFSGCQSSVVGCGVWQWAVLFPVSTATPISLYNAHSSRDVWGQANSCCRLRFFHLSSCSHLKAEKRK